MSFILAIAVFESIDSVRFKRKQYAQKDKGTLGLFGVKDQLKLFEDKSLPIVKEKLAVGKVIYIEQGAEHHYLKLEPNRSLLVMVTRNALERTEITHLFTNMRHALIRQEIVKFTFEDIVDNPIGYNTRNILLKCVSDQIEETKEMTIENIKKVIERGEDLAELQEKANQIRLNAEKFNQGAKKGRRCCK